MVAILIALLSLAVRAAVELTLSRKAATATAAMAEPNSAEGGLKSAEPCYTSSAGLTRGRASFRVKFLTGTALEEVSALRTA